MISVVIPTYRSPAYLDLCLKSATENQVNKNQIIVIIDHEMTPEYDVVVSKYPGIDLLVNEENKGQTYSHNTGVMLAEHEWVLVVNDDNVFPAQWDKNVGYTADRVISINQIEPTPSIFKSFNIKNFGTTPAEFQYQEFLSYSSELSRPYWWDNLTGQDGQTWPLLMQKKWYMILNGIDPNFPSPACADWDFFLRCELVGLKCERWFGCHFYHFAGAATKATPESAQAHAEKEQQSFEYFAHKWGYYPTMRADTHSKIDSTLPMVRGVRFLEEYNE